MEAKGKIKILVVDDSNVIQFALKNFFKDFDCEVFISKDGLEGIEMARLHKPDLIFLDLMMPNLDGIKMLQVLKVLDELKDIPVIVISGNTSRHNVLKAVEAGATKVLSKPLQKEIIKKILKEIFGNDIFNGNKNLGVKSEDEKEIAEQMKKFFLSSFKGKMPALGEYVKKRDRERVYEIVHQLKGAGTTAGFPEITEYSTKFESLLNQPNIDWQKALEYNELITRKFNEISVTNN